MSSFTSLPPELLSEICSHAEVKTCKQLRQTCRSLASIGKQWVFQEAILSPSTDSCERFESIIANPGAAQWVSRVNIDLVRWEFPGEDTDNVVEEDDDSEAEWLALPQRFRTLFHQLAEFPRLRGVNLCFHPETVLDREDSYSDTLQGPDFRSAVISKFMALLVSLPRLPQDLTLHNLQNINETEPSVVANIRQVLGGLRSLRLNTAHGEWSMEGDTIDLPEPHTFFSELPSFWLEPAASNLQHLTIYSNLFFGFFPRVDLQSVHFPQLRSLALGNYEFVHDSQLDWILSHASTLTELYLDDCRILFEVAVDCPERTYLNPAVFEPRKGLPEVERWATYGTRWHHYFRAFNDKLPLLRKFRFGWSYWPELDYALGNGKALISGLMDKSYMVYNDSYGPPYPLDTCMAYMRTDDERRHEDPEDPNRDPDMRYEEPLLPSEDDLTALKELYTRLGQTLPVKEGRW